MLQSAGGNVCLLVLALLSIAVTYQTVFYGLLEAPQRESEGLWEGLRGGFITDFADIKKIKRFSQLKTKPLLYGLII